MSSRRKTNDVAHLVATVGSLKFYAAIGSSDDELTNGAEIMAAESSNTNTNDGNERIVVTMLMTGIGVNGFTHSASNQFVLNSKQQYAALENALAEMWKGLQNN